MRPAQQFCEQCLSFLNWLPPQIAPVQFKQVERAMPALASARCRRINSKTASPFSSQTIQIFIHPFSSFPPLNAIKKIAHTPAARTRSTIKVCIFKHLLSVSAVNRTVLHVSLTVDRVAIRSCGVFFGIGTSIHQVPFLHAHPNGR